MATLLLAAASVQAAPTINYENLEIVEGVGLVDADTNAKYITLGMSRNKLMANAPQMHCLTPAYCEVLSSPTTGLVTVHLDEAGKVFYLRFYQDTAPHKWASRKGAMDGMTLAQVHAIYKGSTLSSTTDPTKSPADGYVRTKNGNYLYQTYTLCGDTGCTFSTVSEVGKASKP
ncbi:hypothetical protein [Ideonella paludis]|uniref:hypothetical protein n=1 Tax=Ideonella paludis TaxID=1233411 RepID=UPI003631128D